GTEVTANTISGHRDMSTTSCPGDFAYGLLATDLPTRVSALRPGGGTPAPTSSTTESAAAEGAPATEPTAESTTTGSTTAAAESSSSVADPTAGQAAASVEAPAEGGSDGLASRGLVIVGAVLGAAAAIGSVISRIWTGPGD
ncbi:MAG: hypothetical protein AAGK32_06685, partial [Actinomycetota bacterium]